MIVEAVKLDVTQYTVQYELLRSQVIGLAGNAAQRETAADQRRGVGLALFAEQRACPNGLRLWKRCFARRLHRVRLTPRTPHRMKVHCHRALRPCAAWRACGMR